MAGYGYRNYRGRSPKWKILLAVVLVLVIAVSATVLGLQRFVVYDETGTPHFLLPQSSESMQAEHENTPPADLVIQEEEDPPAAEATVIRLAPGVVDTAEEADAALAAVSGECTGAAITVKDESGKVFFPSQKSPWAVNTDAVREAVSAVLDGTEYTAARIVCFADPKAANSDVEGLGLKNTGGYIFYDGNNRQWLDPAKADARAYLCGLAAECAQLGFDEIILSHVGYPTEGKLDKIAYGETPLDENLDLFLREMAETLEPLGVTLTVEMTAEGILGGTEAGGLTLKTAAKHAGRICAMAEGGEVAVLAREVESVDAEFVPMLTHCPEDYTGSAILISE
jgi:hypothetical protein